MRRIAGVCVATALALTGVVSASAATPASAPWRQTNGSGAESRANLVESTLTTATVADAHLLRSVRPAPAGTQCDAPHATSPVLSGTHLWALNLDGLSEYQAGTGGLIRRLNLDRSNTVEFSNLALGHGLIIAGGIGCDSVSDPNGQISAFNSSTGAPVWNKSAGPGLGDLVGSGPYVVSAGGTFASGNYVSVLRAYNGSTVWSKTPACGRTPVIVAGGNVVISTCNKNNRTQLAAYRLATGKVAWTRAGTWQVFRSDSDTASDAQVYVMNPSDHVIAISSETGRRLYPMHGASNVLAADDHQVYAACGANAASVCAYDKATGASAWRTAHPATLAIVGGGVLYLSDGAALNTDSGALLTTLWSSTDTAPNPATSLAVGDGRVAAVTNPAAIDLYGLSPH
jgi:outer membrane protein assembly factor BamB